MRTWKCVSLKFGLLVEHIAYKICVFCKSKRTSLPWAIKGYLPQTANICADFDIGKISDERWLELGKQTKKAPSELSRRQWIGTSPGKYAMPC